MTFDPAKHIIKIKARNGQLADYLPVAARIAWLRAEHPDADIDVEAHAISDQVAIFRATVTLPSGGRADGWGSETPADFKDYIEKASTKALGRAIAALGYGTLQAPDLEEGERIVDAPVEQPRRSYIEVGSVPDERRETTRAAVPPSGQSSAEGALATEKQVNFLRARADEAGMSKEELAQWLHQTYQVTRPEDLNRRQASHAIDELKLLATPRD